MRWIAIEGGMDKYINANAIRTIHAEENRDGDWRTYVVDREGKKHRTILDVNAITSPPEHVVPAKPGYQIWQAHPQDDGSITVDQHDVVMWRFVEKLALPVAINFSFEDESYCALAGPGGVITRLPESTTHDGWGCSPKPTTLNGWLNRVAKEAKLPGWPEALPALGRAA